jgi:CheY-like chemotaxis protein
MGPRLAGLRILVVDDDLHVRRVVRVILARAGAVVEEVASATAAWQRLQRFRPHVLVSDLHMPVEDGFGLMRRIRALEGEQNGERLAAIALTGGAGDAEYSSAMHAGFDAFFTKPVSPAVLVAAARSVLAAAPDGG